LILIDKNVNFKRKTSFIIIISKKKNENLFKKTMNQILREITYVIIMYVSIKLILFVKNVYFKDLTMQIEFNWNSIEQENGERLLKSALKYRGKGKRF
jgi:hypothetical protein